MIDDQGTADRSKWIVRWFSETLHESQLAEHLLVDGHSHVNVMETF